MDGAVVTKSALRQYKSQLCSADWDFQGKSPRSHFMPINPFLLVGCATCTHVELALQSRISVPLYRYFNMLWSPTVKVGHYESGDWIQNRPHPIAGWTAEALAEIPIYYIMDLDCTMPETVAPEMPTPAEIAKKAWLPDKALAVYVTEYRRNGFQGGLQWYRVTTTGIYAGEQELFTSRFPSFRKSDEWRKRILQAAWSLRKDSRRLA
jgi:hypothetical protein